LIAGPGIGDTRDPGFPPVPPMRIAAQDAMPLDGILQVATSRPD
jgi:hypothetical protein